MIRVIACLVVLAALAPAGRAQNVQGTLATTPVLPRKRVEAGVTILEHDQTAFARATKLALVATPVTVAGGADGDPAFDLTRVSNVALLSDGRLATLAHVGNHFLIFSATGKGERSLGVTGGGPGELMAPGNMAAMPGDTLVIPDPANHRINWATPDKGIVKSRSLDGSPVRVVDNAAGVLRDGRIVMFSSGLVQQGVKDSITRPPATVDVVSRDGAAREIARIPDLELAMRETRYRGRAMMNATVIGFSRTAHVAVWDTLIATAHGDGYRIDLRNGEGKIASRIVVEAPRRAVSAAMKSRLVAEGLKQLHGPHSEQLVDANESDRLIRENPTADSLPPYSQMFVSPNHTLWVVDYIAPGDTSWAATAFRSDGAIIGRLNGSGAPRPVAFGNDRVVLREADSDGIVSLKVHRIVVDRTR